MVETLPAKLGFGHAVLEGRCTGTVTKRGFKWGTRSGAPTEDWHETGKWSGGSWSYDVMGLPGDTTIFYQAYIEEAVWPTST